MVVCHADACSPNTRVGDDGRCTGHVELGWIGTGDPWADLAIVTWSTEWNCGPGWEGELLAAYGIGADPERTRYYRLLWDLTDRLRATILARRCPDQPLNNPPQGSVAATQNGA